MTFGGEYFYPDIGAKAAALGYSSIMNHPFADGNKRVGHAAMEVFLVLNGYEIKAALDEQERVILNLASSKISRAEFTTWVQDHISKKVEPK
jgi:death-on-curing protein